jgi:uncharacterized delta-60 repeat protein
MNSVTDTRRRRRGVCVGVLAGALMAAVLPFAAQAAPGDLDTSFSGDGTAEFSRGRLDLDSAGIVPLVQADGKIVLIGNAASATSLLAVSRIRPDGTLDRGFGDQGHTYVSTGIFSIVTGAMMQGDRIVVVGGTQAAGGASADTLVARFLSDGRPDTSFGPNGVRVLDIGGVDYASSVVAAADGSLLVAGSSDTDAYIAEVTDAGALDASFGVGGVRRVATGQPLVSDIRPDIAVTPSGAAVIVFTDLGYAPTPVTRLVRVTLTGAIDLSFGGTGEVVQDVSADDEFGKQVLVSGARTFAVTELEGDAWITAFEPDGDVDVTWGVSGKRLVPLSGAESVVAGAALDPGGRIVIAALAIDVGARRWQLVRVLATGSLDATFAGDGSFDREVADGTGPSGVAAGATGYVLLGSEDQRFAVIRLTDAGLPVPGFGAEGLRKVTVSDSTATRVGDVTADPDGRIVALAQTTVGPQPAHATLWRVTRSGRLDRTFGRRGVATIRIPGQVLTPTVVRRLDDGRYLVAMTARDDTRSWVVLARLTSAGDPDLTFGPAGRRVVAASAIRPTERLHLQVDEQGRYVVVADEAAGVHVVRLRPNGRPDRTFGPGGRRFVATEPGETPRVEAMAILTSGRIAFVDTGTLRTVRFRASGLPDTGFGPGGARPLATPATFTSPTASITREGRIALATSLSGGGTSIARLRPNGDLDTGFGTAGVFTLAAGPSTAYELRTVLLRSDGAVIAAGFRITLPGLFTSISSAVIRLTPAGALDPTFSGDGVRMLDLAPGAIDAAVAVSVRARSMVIGSISLEPGSRLLLTRLRS